MESSFPCCAYFFLPRTLVHPFQVCYTVPDDKLDGGGCCARMAAGRAKAASAVVCSDPSCKPRLLLMERFRPCPCPFRSEVLSVKRRRILACPCADTSGRFYSEHRRRCRIGRPAGHRPRAVGADCHIAGGTRRVRVSGGAAECQGHRGKAAAGNSRCAGGRKCGGKRLTGTGTDHTNTKLHHQGDDSHVPHPISRRRRCLG